MGKGKMSRRRFLSLGVLAGVNACGTATRRLKTPVGAKMDPVFKEYQDDVTGARVQILTEGTAHDQTVYQTHPMWVHGMDFLMFDSDRAGAGRPPHVLEMKTGAVRAVLDRDCADRVLARKDDRLFFLGGREVWVTRVLTAFSGDIQSSRVTSLPDWAAKAEGNFSLDASEEVLYTGVVLEDGVKWGLAALEISSGAWRKVVELDFQIGHVQANPFVPGIIMFCHETGGDAAQRMWVVNGDGSGLRPFYKETYDEWVTHEVWWGPDRAIFTVWPYDEERARRPHGILSADLATGAPTVHSQYPAWHTHGSPDGQWALGDDFDRSIWLVKIGTGERRLLTQGHNGKGHNTHPHASFTPDSRAVVFNSSRDGSERVYLVELPEWESLPKA